MLENICKNCFEQKAKGEKCPHCLYNGELPEKGEILPPGTILNGSYMVGKVLGHGGFGITYLGYDLNFELKVAIKEYYPDGLCTRTKDSQRIYSYSGDAASNYQYGLAKFIDEGKTMAKFGDISSIVNVRSYFQENNTAYLVMEFLDGMTLREQLISQPDKKLSWDETKSLMRPVINALSEVHKKGIIHRDIAPDNIFITKRGTVKLLDFGAARYAISEKSKSLSVILKPGYAPPEQYYSKGKQGPWTDVYAVAATMYKLLTGVTPPEAMERVMDDNIQYTGKIPPQIIPILSMALNVNIADRYNSMDELLNAVYNNAAPQNNYSAKNNYTNQATQTAPTEYTQRSSEPLSRSISRRSEDRDAVSIKSFRNGKPKNQASQETVGLSKNHPFIKLLMFTAAFIIIGLIMTTSKFINYKIGYTTIKMPWLFIYFTSVLAIDIAAKFSKKISKKYTLVIVIIAVISAGIALLYINNGQYNDYGISSYIRSLNSSMIPVIIIAIFSFVKGKASKVFISIFSSISLIYVTFYALMWIFAIGIIGETDNFIAHSVSQAIILIPLFLWTMWNIFIKAYYTGKPVKKSGWALLILELFTMCLVAYGFSYSFDTDFEIALAVTCLVLFTISGILALIQSILTLFNRNKNENPSAKWTMLGDSSDTGLMIISCVLILFFLVLLINNFSQANKVLEEINKPVDESDIKYEQITTQLKNSNILYKDDFEQYDLGVIPSDWKYYGDSSQGVIEENDNKSFSVNSSTYAIMSFPLAPSSEIVFRAYSTTSNGVFIAYRYEKCIIVNLQEGWHEYRLILYFDGLEEQIYIDGERFYVDENQDSEIPKNILYNADDPEGAELSELEIYAFGDTVYFDEFRIGEIDESKIIVDDLSEDLEALVRKELKLSSSSNITKENIKKITNLSIKSDDKDFSLDGLSSIINLETLHISGSSHAHLDEIGELPNLKEVSFSKVTDIYDLNFLKNSISLEKVNIYSTTPNVNDYTALAFIETLKSLELPSNIKDISWVSKLENLEELDIMAAENITSLAPLASLKNLKILQAGNNDNLRDVSALSGLTNLEEIYFLGCRSVGNIEFFVNLPKLKEVEIDDITYNRYPNTVKALKSRGCSVLRTSDVCAGG